MFFKLQPRFEMISSIEAVNTAGRELVAALIKERGTALLKEASAQCRRSFAHETHVLVPVLYPECDVWEVGLVPKNVQFDGVGVASDGVYLRHKEAATWRGPSLCRKIGEYWTHDPD